MGYNHETSPKGDCKNEFNGYRELLARGRQIVETCAAAISRSSVVLLLSRLLSRPLSLVIAVEDAVSGKCQS